jgi:hypothetical protein
MGAFIAAVIAGLVAAAAAAAPWQIYARRIIPSLSRAQARSAAYVVAAFPALAASAAIIARLAGSTTGSIRTDITLIAAAIGVASAWGPIVQAALRVTGGPASTSVGDGVPEAMRYTAFALSTVLALGSLAWFVTPAYASLRACIDAEAILASADPAPSNPTALADSLTINPPEAGAQFGFSFAINLETAATMKHDSESRDQLLRSGFVEGYMRAWVASDGRGIQTEVFEFQSTKGALAYQSDVTRHACDYANEAFAAPLGGIGLQVRYETGDPLVEQVSWVAGSRRYYVMISALAAPLDHSRILAIQRAALASPPPSNAPQMAPGAGPFEGLVPVEVGGIPVEYSSTSNPEVIRLTVLEQFKPWVRPFEEDLSNLSVAMGFVFDEAADVGLEVLVLKVAGSEKGDVRDQMRISLHRQKAVTSESRLGGKRVLAVTTRGSSVPAYLYFHDELAFVVVGDTEELVIEALSKLP